MGLQFLGGVPGGLPAAAALDATAMGRCAVFPWPLDSTAGGAAAGAAAHVNHAHPLAAPGRFTP